MEGLEILKAFEGKKVFITGHTGFKGSWLFYWLQLLGAQVQGYALPPSTNPSLFTALYKKNPANSTLGNINDYNKLSKAMIAFEPDFIFHLAAQPLVRQSYKTPVETFTTNAIGTAHVLESVKQVTNSCVCICVTTDKVYENKEWLYPYRECDRLGGYDPYSASKACAELVIASYRNSFFNVKDSAKHQKSITSVRAGNVIGGGDWSEDRLLPDMIRAWSAEKTLAIRNPNAVRPWQHVMEPLLGYMKLALHLAEEKKNDTNTTSAWNFGPSNGDNLSVMAVANLATAIWKNATLDTVTEANQPHEAQLLTLDISKATSLLHWKPCMNAKIAIEKTIAWYQGFYSGINAATLVKRDIAYYQTLINNT